MFPQKYRLFDRKNLIIMKYTFRERLECLKIYTYIDNSVDMLKRDVC